MEHDNIKFEFYQNLLKNVNIFPGTLSLITHKIANSQMFNSIEPDISCSVNIRNNHGVLFIF